MEGPHSYKVQEGVRFSHRVLTIMCYTVSMKTCTKCLEEKSLADFHKRAAAKDGRQNWCKTCSIAFRKNYYKTNPENQKATRISAANARIRNRDHVLAHLQNNPCIDCGEDDIIVLHFDHVRGVKAGNISKMINDGTKFEKLQEEMDKCVIRCANCHMRKTAKDFGWFKAVAI